MNAGKAFESGAFNIREQLQRSKPDYFNIKSVRGSSPTASLAADLSQNFRIDNEARYVVGLQDTRQSPCVLTLYVLASPRFPTPRRALFTSGMMGGMESRGRLIAESNWVKIWEY
jgi:M-phase inducer tyrosine phosphatase